MHNVSNATAAVAVAMGLDVPAEKIAEGLANFRGVDRRFQRKGEIDGVTVVDDYGHHPTEIEATLAAARQYTDKKIHVIFQPHRYTRTRDLMEEFAKAFTDCDTLTVLDIYAASEQPIDGVNGEALAKKIAEHHASVAYQESFEAAVASVKNKIKTGDLVLTLGAGNVSQIGPMILETTKA